MQSILNATNISVLEVQHEDETYETIVISHDDNDVISDEIIQIIKNAYEENVNTVFDNIIYNKYGEYYNGA